MDSVISFGDHDFTPANQVSFPDVFASMTTKSTPIFGVDGGFDVFGNERSPVKVARLRLSLWLHGTQSDMDNQRRALAALTVKGKQQLTIAPSGGIARNRYCNARLMNLQMPQTVKKRPDIRQFVNMMFEVNNPVWIEVPTTSFIWGQDMWAFARWGAATSPFALSGLSTDLMITIEGNIPSAPLFTFSTAAGQQITGLTIQRMVAGSVVQEIEYTDTIGANSSFIIDCRALSVTLDSVSAYGSAFTARSRQWMELQPTVENTIRVLMGDAGDECTLDLYYLRLYR